MKRCMIQVFYCLCAVLWIITPCRAAHAESWIPLTGAVHVHSSEFSSGDHTLSDLVEMGRKGGLDVIVLTDHDNIALSYGVPPFRHLLSMTFSRNSVLKQGARKYLEAVNKIDAENKDMILIPGIESAPFYYWTGSIWKGDLTVHGLRKHIHVIGLTRPEDIERLPILENGFSTHYVMQLLPRFLFFTGIILLSLVLITWKGIFKTAGRIFLVLGILGAWDAHPFKSSLFDPYHGDQGTGPFQEVIDYADSHGGMTFWAHPEANYGASEAAPDKKIAGFKLPKVFMVTEKHPSDLIRTNGYTGFESLYGDTIHATEPGREWDQVLIRYCDGVREKPAWGFCGLDFHKQGQNSWSYLDRGETIFWVREKTREQVLDAMRNGRMYAVYQGGTARIRLDDFSMASQNHEDGAAMSGGTVEARGDPMSLHIVVSLSDAASVPVRIEIIDSGNALYTLEGMTPLNITQDIPATRAKGYIRVVVRADKYKIVTNPIFYKDPTRLTP
ncbi:MAG: hypothetical protein AABY87_01300 [bacterium]